MKPCTISHQNATTHLKWLLWLSLGLGILYFILSIDAYISGEETWEWIINIVIGLIWMASGFFQIKGSKYYFPEITLNDAGITYKIKNNENRIQWDQIKGIYLDNNTLVIHTETNEDEALNIAHLQYKELQTVKNRLQEATEGRNIPYSSKY